MIGPGSKISNRVLNQKTEKSEKNTKFGPLSKCRSESNKVVMEVSSKKKISASCLPPEMAAKNYREACDHQVKTKLSGLTPRNPEKETSEGVQEFIKHVSDIIEKKNPLKETSRCSYQRGGQRNANSAYQSIQFNGVGKNFQGRKKSEDLKLDRNWVIVREERDTNSSKNPKCIENPVPSHGKDSACINGKTSKWNSSTKRRERSVNKFERDMSLEAQKTDKKANKNISSLYQKTEEQDITLCTRTHLSQERVSSAPLQNQFKRRRPSEIPLRKDRMDSTKKPKPLSLLLRKPLEAVESTASVDSSSRDKPFSPKEELDLCSEFQMTIKLDLSSEKINIDEEIQLPFSEERAGSIKLNRCHKSTDVPEMSELSSESKREKPSGKRSKVIDCERVKTSSFTVISSSNTVLDRLEFLHKKNVHSKEKSFGGKIVSHRKKDLVLKTSQNSLKGKSSKKCLLSRLNSKGNKAGPSMKVKRTKRDGNQDPGNPRKSRRRPKIETETPHLDIYREIIASGRVGCPMPTNRKLETIRSERLKTNTSKLEKDDGQPRRLKSARRKSTPRNLSSPRDKEKPETPSERRISGSEFENPKYEKPISARTGALSKTESTEDLEVGNSSEKDVETAIETQNAIPTTPPPTPEKRNGFDFEQMEEDDEWASKTADNKINNENYTWCTIESETDPTCAIIVTEKAELSSTESSQTEKAKLMDLVVWGMSLNYGKDESLEKSQEMESPTVKKQLKINLSAHGVTSDCDGVEDNEENESASIREETRKAPTLDKANSNDTEMGVKEGKSKSGKNGSADSVSPVVVEEPGSLSLDLQKPRKSCLSLKRKSNHNSGGAVNGARKKKVRSDAGDRLSPSASVFFNSNVTLQGKTKPDTKPRSGLTKSSKREEKLDMFEDTAVLKLRRRNSEPNSFRGYVWKCADSATPRGNKASVSSMTSSLRHLNTDEIDDFIFWEAVPQKMTSCWEMSLYNFKRPWSVLSYSVFRDNRKSNTPGLILENLRNGGTLSTRRSTINQTEGVTCRKENPFDVEPSIAQKNIDIRNWLAALNFPTLPSTSTDVLGEGNFSSQTVFETRSLKKTQASHKRRKVLPNLKISDEASKKKADEEKKECRESTRWNPNDQEGLTELIRRKSGGFVTKEQYLNSELLMHRPNVTVNFCVYSKSAEESILAETSDKNAVCEPRKYKSVEVASQPEVSISATIISSSAVSGDQLVEKIKTKEKPTQEIAVREGNGHSKGEPGHCRTDVNIWKYLFILTLFLIIIHYWFMNSYVCRN